MLIISATLMALTAQATNKIRMELAQCQPAQSLCVTLYTWISTHTQSRGHIDPWRFVGTWTLAAKVFMP